MRAPIRRRGRRRTRVARRDRGLQRVRPERAAQASARSSACSPRRISNRSQRPRSCSSNSTGSPSGPVRAALRDAWISSNATRPWTSGSCRRELGQHAREAQRVVAERGPQPIVAGRRGVALVEHEVDDLEHRREPLGERLAARHLERHARLGQRALRAHDALRDRRLRHEERARDLGRREAADHAQRQRDARLHREHGVARDEHQAQHVVADLIVERLVDRLALVADLPAQRLELSAELLVLAPHELRAADAYRSRDASPSAMSHAPGLSGMPSAGHCSSAATSASCASSSATADVAHDAREARDELRPLDAEDRLDRGMRRRSRHLPNVRQARHGQDVELDLAEHVGVALRPLDRLRRASRARRSRSRRRALSTRRTARRRASACRRSCAAAPRASWARARPSTSSTPACCHLADQCWPSLPSVPASAARRLPFSRWLCASRCNGAS